MREDIKQAISFMKKTDVRFRFFSMTIFFSIGLACINLYIITLLFPLLRGIINSNFDHVQEERFLGYFIQNYPGLLSNSIRLFILLVVWIYFVVIIKNIFQYITTVSTDYQAKQATINLRDMLLDTYLKFEKSFFDIHKTHIISSALTKSGTVIEKQFNLLKNFIVQICLALTFLTMMFIVSFKLTLVALFVLPLITFFTRKYVKKIRIVIQESQKVEHNLNKKISNMLQNIPVIKAFAKEEHERSSFKKISVEEIDKSFKTKKISSLLPAIEDMGATTALLLLAFGIAFIVQGTGTYIDPIRAFVFLYLSQRMIPSLNSFNAFSVGMSNLKKDIKDINEILEENERHIISSGHKEFKGLEEGIEIKNLTFTYQDTSEAVLSNLNLYIPKGKTTAIVGPTGSGKSTIVNLLMRFYEVNPSSIFIDETDIRDFNIQSIRKKIAYVGQETIFFTDTVFNNVGYGVENISRDFIKDVCKKVTVDFFVQKMPQKYQTLIQERGSNLSGGQKQRLAIARALVRDFDILILDETTNSLDSKVEHTILEAINEIAPSKTKIIISHKFSTIAKADMIICIEKGKVVEQGTVDELLSLQGEFYKNWQLQNLK